LWPVIEKRNATAFVWGGDAVYADDRVEWKYGIFPRRLDATPDYLKQLFLQQREHRGYQALLKTNISIFGTIDDHDYGVNNGDQTFKWKKENGLEFVEFLGLSKESAMSQRAAKGLGIYGVQVYDFSRGPKQRLLSDQEAGLDPDIVPIVLKQQHEETYSNVNEQLVAVFVLDIRTNKTPWSKAFPKRFAPDLEGDFLGEQQWEWFETAIRRSHAAVNIVVTGLQAHAERFYDGNIVESWSGFPKAQHRLYQALLQPNVQAPILISGDVHQAQLLRKDCRKRSTPHTIRPLYEITTSGMTHSWGTKVCGRANFNLFCQMRYYNAIYRPVLDIAHWISPWTELLFDEETNTAQYSLDLNVAELEFDWNHQSVSVHILGEDDRVLLYQNWSFKALTGTTGTITQVKGSDFDGIQQRLQDHPTTPGNNNEDEWMCVHYRGLPGRMHFAIGVVSVSTLLFALGILPLVLCLLAGRAVLGGGRKNPSKRLSRTTRAKKNH
jgi:alkaline phosphatase D